MKIRHFDPKIRKKMSGEGALPSPQTLPHTHLFGAFGASTQLAPSALDLAPNFNS